MVTVFFIYLFFLIQVARDSNYNNTIVEGDKDM